MNDEGDAAADRINSAFADAIQAGECGETSGGMPSTWAFVGSYFDSEGESRTVFLANNDARLQETIGMLRMGVIAWDEQARRWVHDE